METEGNFSQKATPDEKRNNLTITEKDRKDAFEQRKSSSWLKLILSMISWTHQKLNQMKALKKEKWQVIVFTIFFFCCGSFLLPSSFWIKSHSSCVSAAAAMPEVWRSVPHHSQHADECPKLPVTRHLHHPPLSNESLSAAANGEIICCWNSSNIW